MSTCSIAYESNGHTNGEATMLLIHGFSGCLKMWWDHALTNEYREAIKTHKTKIRKIVKIEYGT